MFIIEPLFSGRERVELRGKEFAEQRDNDTNHEATKAHNDEHTNDYDNGIKKKLNHILPL